ncbi:hypothetical protein C8R43DRAFT_1018434 [Mycena crocata]|nr:hypothetical protein C8R43DRAFT_1018434 [Mycena crocata]
MSFTYELRVGGCSLDTHIRFQPPFKMQFMKFTRKITKRNRGAKTRRARAPIFGWRMAFIQEIGSRKVKWLSLDEKQLALYPSRVKEALRSYILLRDVSKLERSELAPCGLTLETKDNKSYLLSFDNDSDLYAWQDDISLRSMGVSRPYNFVHEAHATFDPEKGGITGLPDGWDQVLLNTNTTTNNYTNDTSLLIRFRSPKVNLSYVWAIRSLSENLQDILEGLKNILVLAGETTPLVGTVGDLQGRELSVLHRTPSDEANASTTIPQCPSEQIWMRVDLSASFENNTTIYHHCSRMQMEDVLQLVCWRGKIRTADYNLTLAGEEVPLALNRTVADLDGKRQLALIQRPRTPLDETTLHIDERGNFARLKTRRTAPRRGAM